jgi:cell division septum initiation protein DivIVA
MSQSAAEQVEAIKALVGQAKAVPMSASCMVNRAEIVGRLDRALTSIGAEQELARRQSGAEAIEDARAQADRIMADAHDEAARMLAEDAVHAEAIAKASELSETTLNETEALKREADAYVDQRMAEFEAYMTKTLTQLKTLRTRLSERSGLDVPTDD